MMALMLVMQDWSDVAESTSPNDDDSRVMSNFLPCTIPSKPTEEEMEDSQYEVTQVSPPTTSA